MEWIADGGCRMKPVFVPFGDVDQFEPEAVECYERARKKAEEEGTRVKVLMLCNPHNPLGRCYPKETLVKLLKFCNEHKIHLIADEIVSSIGVQTPFSSVPAPIVP